MKKQNKVFKILSAIFIVVFVVVIISIVAFIISFIRFSSDFVPPQEEIFQSIGEYECLGYYSSGGVRDFTDYAIYSYNNPEIEKVESFSKVSDTEELNAYLDDFEEWVVVSSEEESLKKNYDFDRSVIDESDYLYIADKSTEDSTYEKYRYYDIYIYDTQNQKLYYFHNNF